MLLVCLFSIFIHNDSSCNAPYAPASSFIHIHESGDTSDIGMVGWVHDTLASKAFDTPHFGITPGLLNQLASLFL